MTLNSSSMIRTCPAQKIGFHGKIPGGGLKREKG
jgi:hypothetical protein